jgi:electron transfer flavoprotein beta subunit
VNIAVCVKQVPDSWAEKKMANGLLDRDGVDAVLNDLDEYAVEEALRIVEAHGGNGEAGPHKITVISMGPERASDAVRKALSMGADSAIVVTDPALVGSDALATSKVLAKVIESGSFDLVICGTESTDARMSVVPAMLAQRLKWASLTFAGSVVVDPGTKVIQISRQTEAGVDSVKAVFPVVVSVVEKINEPRYPSFKGIMSAKKKVMEIRDLASLSIDAASVGSAGAWSTVVDAVARPPRTAGVKIVDEGSAGKALVDFLVEKKLI